MKIITILAVLFLSICKSFSQENLSIQTDRPDQTECPFIVPKRYFQIESGISFTKLNATNNEIILPSILTKYGLNDNFELRIITEIAANQFNKDNNFRINPVLIGFKTSIIKEKGIVPTISFIGHISIPKMASKTNQTTFAAPEFRFTMQHTISEKKSFSYNIGAEWDGEFAEPVYLYTVTTGYSLSKKIGFYLEFYGFLPQIEKPNHTFDGGLTYLFNPNQQLDLSAGFGLNSNSLQQYIALGYSFRFKK